MMLLHNLNKKWRNLKMQNKTCVTEFEANDVICHRPPGNPGKEFFWKITKVLHDTLPTFGPTIYWNVVKCTKTGKTFKYSTSFTLHPRRDKDFYNGIFTHVTTCAENTTAISTESIKRGADKRRMGYLRGVIENYTKELKELEEKYGA